MSNDLDKFFEDATRQIEESFRIVRAELEPGSDAETRLIQLYHQAKLGLEPRKTASTRKAPGIRPNISPDRVLDAALTVLRKQEVESGKASVVPGRLPVLKHGFKQRVVDQLHDDGEPVSKTVVYDIISGEKFRFLLAMKYEGR